MNLVLASASSRPTAWPHVVIEDGPSLAGVGVGDVVSFPLHAPLACGVDPWSASDRLALRITRKHAAAMPHAHRVMTNPLRLERRVNLQDEWHVVNAAEHVVVLGPWRLHFVLDGAPLGTVKRFGEHTVAHCMRIALVHNPRARFDVPPHVESRWLVPAHGASRELLVRETLNGETTTTLRARAAGIDLYGVKHLAGGPLDVEIAAGIAMQAEDDHTGVARIGWDGVLRHLSDERTRPGTHRYGCRARIFAVLTDARDLDRAVVELQATRAADLHEVSAFISALDREAAAREAALVEECGVLAG